MIEDMSYLIESGETEKQDAHYSQEGTAMRVKVVFCVPTPDDEDPLKLVTIKIPRYFPIYRQRDLIDHAKKGLTEIYGDAKQVGVLAQKEGSSTWETSWKVPTFNVVYI